MTRHIHSYDGNDAGSSNNTTPVHSFEEMLPSAKIEMLQIQVPRQIY